MARNRDSGGAGGPSRRRGIADVWDEGLIEPREASDQKPVCCEVCEREVPRDEAHSVEGRDTVWFFCGLDCFEEWRRLSEA